MKRIALVSRLLMGGVFLVFGLDGLLHFMPLPPMPAAATAFIHTLMGSGLFYAVKALEISSALLLLSGRFVPLALAVLAPIIFNIVWFDAALDHGGLAVGVVLAALELTLIWQSRGHFAPIFSRTASVTS